MSGTTFYLTIPLMLIMLSIYISIVQRAKPAKAMIGVRDKYREEHYVTSYRQHDVNNPDLPRSGSPRSAQRIMYGAASHRDTPGNRVKEQG